MSLKNKIGKFTIHDSFIGQFPGDTKRIMGKCIIIQCEHYWGNNVFGYTALSEEFEELETCELVPEYTWIKDWDGQMRADHA